MDPVTISVVAAISSGALAATQEVTSSAIKDAYAGLKRFITDRYSHATAAVQSVEANPESEPEQKKLASELHGVEADPEAKRLTLALLEALEKAYDQPNAQPVIDVRKIRAARNFKLSDAEFFGPLIHSDEIDAGGDVEFTGLRQKAKGSNSGN
jgi:hypothetical protein